MTPDEQHQKYYKDNPKGNHEEPSGETLRFMQNQNEINKSVDEKMEKLLVTGAEIKMTVYKILEQTERTNRRVTKLEHMRTVYEPQWKETEEEKTEHRSKQMVWYSGWAGMAINMIGAALSSGVAIIITLSRLGIIFK